MCTESGTQQSLQVAFLTTLKHSDTDNNNVGDRGNDELK